MAFSLFYVGIYSHQCVITDARHDSSRAAMHSTVSAISMSNKKIIAVCNWSRENERSAPSREVPMTKEMITNLIENQGCLMCFTMSLLYHNLCVWYGRVAGN